MYVRWVRIHGTDRRTERYEAVSGLSGRARSYVYPVAVGHDDIGRRIAETHGTHPPAGREEGYRLAPRGTQFVARDPGRESLSVGVARSFEFDDGGRYVAPTHGAVDGGGSGTDRLSGTDVRRRTIDDGTGGEVIRFLGGRAAVQVESIIQKDEKFAVGDPIVQFPTSRHPRGRVGAVGTIGSLRTVHIIGTDAVRTAIQYRQVLAYAVIQSGVGDAPTYDH